MISKWESTELTSVNDAMSLFLKLCKKGWLFRGQAKHYNSLIPSIDRGKLNKLERNEKLILERQSIERYRSAVKFPTHSFEVKSIREDLIALMILRHHGTPTRLLDWSMCPYVAAYFAALENEGEDGELWCFDRLLYEEEGKKQWKQFPETTTDGSGQADKFDNTCKTAFSLTEPNDWFVCEFYEEGFPRHNAQKSAYSLTSCFNKDHADSIATVLNNRKHHHLYIVKSNIKHDLLDELQKKYGIGGGSLFPDVAGAARFANEVFQPYIQSPMNNYHLRIARPTDNMAEVIRFYRDGLGFEIIASFADHQGFDGVMLGHAGFPYHFEFTHHHGHAAGKAPTQDNLLVFYIPDDEAWHQAVRRMTDHGFLPVASYNPYWDNNGTTFEDIDGYRVVLNHGAWR